MYVIKIYKAPLAIMSSKSRFQRGS